MERNLMIAGFGGQGVMLIGNLLAQAGMEHGLEVSFIPVYGAEMRGGTANCTVILSEERIGERARLIAGHAHISQHLGQRHVHLAQTLRGGAGLPAPRGPRRRRPGAASWVRQCSQGRAGRCL